MVVNIHHWCDFTTLSVPLWPDLPVSRSSESKLSRRERQIMDIVYRRARATAAEVADELPDPPTLDAVRAALRLLESRGHLRHEQDGPRYVYLPTTPREAARQSALQHMVRTFFGGSPEQLVTALFESDDVRPSGAQLERIASLVEQARKEEEQG